MILLSVYLILIKKRQRTMIGVLVCIWTVLLLLGCSPAGPQPIIHPVAGTHLMMIPKGTQIGKQVAPENGIYIGESLTRPQPPQEQPKPKKKNFNYDKTADKIDI